MNIKYWIVSFVCMGLGLSGCSEDWLNLNPSTAMPEEEAITTLEDAKSALNGIYRLASAHSYYGDNYLYYADCRGEDVQARVSKGAGGRVSPYYEFNVIPTDAFNVTRVWNQPYIVIRQCNSLMQKIEQGDVETTDTKALESIYAQALVMRALAHFDLTRLFGMPYTNDGGASMGVPLELVPGDYDNTPSRSSVKACYDQVLTDLGNAVGKLPDTKTDGFMNYWSTKALMARVYLYKGDYENALACAEEVILKSKNIYQLFTHDEYPTVWGKDFNSESLFEFYFTLSEPAGGSGGEGAPMVYADNKLDWNNLVLTKDFLDLLGEDPEDIRLQLVHMPLEPETDVLPAGSSGHPKYLRKYPGKSGDILVGSPQDNDLCILRLSEVYLNAAEAAFKLGEIKGEDYYDRSLTYLNAIVSRANPKKSVSREELTLDRILKERRKELVGEGHAFFDYMRNGKSIKRSGGWHLSTIPVDAGEIRPTDYRVVLPIPQAEIDANDSILQNLGY